jgi:hypothetical protein
MTEDLNREQSATNRTNHRVHRVPDGINPWNLVSEKFENIENTRDADDPRVAEDFERLILRRENDPVKMECQPSRKHGEIKINPGERGEAESHGHHIDSFHVEKIDRREGSASLPLAI